MNRTIQSIAVLAAFAIAGAAHAQSNAPVAPATKIAQAAPAVTTGGTSTGAAVTTTTVTTTTAGAGVAGLVGPAAALITATGAVSQAASGETKPTTSH